MEFFYWGKLQCFHLYWICSLKFLIPKCIDYKFCSLLLAVLHPVSNQLVQGIPDGVRVSFSRPSRPANIPSPPPLIPTTKPTDKPSFIQGGSISQVKQPKVLFTWMIHSDESAYCKVSQILLMFPVEFILAQNSAYEIITCCLFYLFFLTTLSFSGSWWYICLRVCIFILFYFLIVYFYICALIAFIFALYLSVCKLDEIIYILSVIKRIRIKN